MVGGRIEPRSSEMEDRALMVGGRIEPRNSDGGLNLETQRRRLEPSSSEGGVDLEVLATENQSGHGRLNLETRTENRTSKRSGGNSLLTED
jgi:hypothetical protein